MTWLRHWSAIPHSGLDWLMPISPAKNSRRTIKEWNRAKAWRKRMTMVTSELHNAARQRGRASFVCLCPKVLSSEDRPISEYLFRYIRSIHNTPKEAKPVVSLMLSVWNGPNSVQKDAGAPAFVEVILLPPRSRAGTLESQCQALNSIIAGD